MRCFDFFDLGSWLLLSWRRKIFNHTFIFQLSDLFFLWLHIWQIIFLWCTLLVLLNLFTIIIIRGSHNYRHIIYYILLICHFLSRRNYCFTWFLLGILIDKFFLNIHYWSFDFIDILLLFNLFRLRLLFIDYHLLTLLNLFHNLWLSYLGNTIFLLLLLVVLLLKLCK